MIGQKSVISVWLFGSFASCAAFFSSIFFWKAFIISCTWACKDAIDSAPTLVVFLGWEASELMSMRPRLWSFALLTFLFYFLLLRRLLYVHPARRYTELFQIHISENRTGIEVTPTWLAKWSLQKIKVRWTKTWNEAQWSRSNSEMKSKWNRIAPTHPPSPPTPRSQTSHQTFFNSFYLHSCWVGPDACNPQSARQAEEARTWYK